AKDGALFPHLSVLANVQFGLAKGHLAEADALIDLVGLAGLGRRYPHELSGGQQQRVALARALAIRPTVILLDEPFGSLDASLRVNLGQDVVAILRQIGATTILVTHDQNEALALADRVAVLHEGRIVAYDEPRRVYQEPADLAAATAIGDGNELEAKVHDGLAVCVLGEITVRSAGSSIEGPARLLLRPEQIVLSATPTVQGVSAEVKTIRYHGHDALVWVRLTDAGSVELLARVAGDQPLVVGQRVWIDVVGEGRAWPG
ncbi:MAG: ABC transporter ATP-binding protein, partial [Candidatus Limnocylindrales bacterium]